MKVKKSYRLIFALVYNIIVYIVIPWIVLIIGKNIVYHPIDFVGVFICMYQLVGTLLWLSGLYIYKKLGGVIVYYLIFQIICVLVGVMRLTYFMYKPIFPDLLEIGSLLFLASFPVLIIEITVVICCYVKEHYSLSVIKK